MPKRDIRRIRERFLSGDVERTDHFDQRLIQRMFNEEDIASIIILTGSIVNEERRSRDPRDHIYTVSGRDTAGKLASIVCRFTMEGKLLLITIKE